LKWHLLVFYGDRRHMLELDLRDGDLFSRFQELIHLVLMVCEVRVSSCGDSRY